MKRVFLSACMLLCLGVVCGTVSPALAAPQDKVLKKLAKAGAKKNKKAEKAEKAEKREKPEKAEKKKAEKPAKPGKADSGKIGPVAEVLKDLPYITDARPNLHAKQYKYMQSATWCSVCNLKMPDMVKDYNERYKAQGIEIILISADDTEEKAKAFMEKYNAPFPCVMRSCPDLQKLPHYRTSSRLPDIFTVSAEGELLSDGSPMRGRPD
ncbi:MAG: redoxin domain-containing protein [Akkermansia sp.]|nr:redoxin domain-containing protein [Akkermansia sp.]